jgi:DmsE family decaheme c-type cytochrome
VWGHPDRRSIAQGVLVLLALVFCLGQLQGSLSAEDNEVERVSEACLDCHEDYDQTLASSPHQLSPDRLDGPDAPITCIDCHPGDPAHYEDDPEEHPLLNPADAGVPDAAYVCSSCHLNSHQQNMVEGNVHAEFDVNCSSCHKVHDSSLKPGLKRDEEPDLCYTCHRNVEGQFAQPYRHPVSDGIVECSECHLTLDRMSTELSMNGSNEACYDCHPGYQGPFPFEHQATVDYSTEEGGCLTCHDPHGSSQPRMLRQPYEPPHFQLCTQCHGVPPLHQFNQQHGNEWAGVSCNECHSDIHGSYSSSKFLSESLEGEGCFTPACHPPGR